MTSSNGSSSIKVVLQALAGITPERAAVMHQPNTQKEATSTTPRSNSNATVIFQALAGITPERAAVMHST